MTTKQKFLYICLPIFIFTFIINFYVKDDTSPPSVKEYLFNNFEKAEYQVKDLVTGDVLGDKITMQLGMDLYSKYKNNINELNYQVVLDELENLSGVCSARLLHYCFDSSPERFSAI